ncbi:unnamed protein product [Rotaria sp. Silwood1]|nr:unnamed protein product [Rotaria sp. Silwood1]CAF1253709.1 unnamed protein product [Rotaria sp. Silwood1]CAF3499426.1 unnamed protein product [Rotaria sp. Silwood1]CAF3505658.1 unnamed protein product [Rotaria sp. Silwood1]CAF3507989.1 unnamed protein product [Rotaria sp. Silwood1]
MRRSFTIHATFCIVCISILFQKTDAVKKRSYSSGIADLVRTAFKRGLSRFINRETSYDSDVFHYTQAVQRGYDGLFSGESCRLSPMICSHDEQCCTRRCLCRRWLIMGEERCIRKCL